MKRRLFPCAGLMIALAGIAAAGPITYSFTGTARGTLAGTPFAGVTLEVETVGDTNNVQPILGVLINTQLTGTVTIQGLGSYQLSNSHYVFVNQSAPLVGFGVDNIPNCCDMILNFNPVFATYDLQSSIGPVLFPGEDPVVSAWFNVPTSGGLLSVSSFMDHSFQAVTETPEPGTFALMAAGIGVAALRLRSRRE